MLDTVRMFGGIVILVGWLIVAACLLAIMRYTQSWGVWIICILTFVGSVWLVPLGAAMVYTAYIHA